MWLSGDRFDGNSAAARRRGDDRVVRVPFARALEMVASGEIEECKTIIGLTAAATRLESQSLMWNIRWLMFASPR